MTLEEYADSIHAEIMVKRFRYQLWRAWLPGHDLREREFGANLDDDTGLGKTVEEAMHDLCHKIAGKVLVRSDDLGKRVFMVPEGLQ